LEEIVQQRRIFGAHRRLHRRTCSKRGAPSRKLRFAGQNAKIADLVEHVEIAEHRTKGRVHEREFFSVEPWRSSQATLEPGKAGLELDNLGLEGSLVRRGIKPGNIVEHCR